MFDYNQKSEFDPGNIIQIDNVLDTTSTIFFGYDIEEQFNNALEKATQDIPVDRLFLLTDPTLLNLFGQRFLSRLSDRFPDTELYLLPEGEASRSFEVLQKLCNQLVEKGVNKRSLLIAFGGGSIGMKIAAELSAKLGYIDSEARALHYRLIDELLAMKPRFPKNLEPESILKTMVVDKKKQARM